MKELIENLVKLQTLEFPKTTDPAAQKQAAELRILIPAPILAHYDRLVQRGKKGVAGVRNQVCTGCHVQVPRATVVTLMHGDDIQICESCGRYLYLTEAAAEPKKVRRKKSAAENREKAALQAV
jgi:predicted  nucleic acid-binding Zn-ribbon protein